MSWKRAFLLLLFVPPFLLEQAFGWVAGLSSNALYRENTRIREARRLRALAKQRASSQSE